MLNSSSQRRDARVEGAERLSYILACIFMSAASAMFSFDVSTQAEVSNAELQSRLNPNEATTESLMRLLRVGVKTAEKIVAYREGYNGDGPAFRNADDLRNINGIGPKTVEALREHLYFEKTE